MIPQPAIGLLCCALTAVTAAAQQDDKSTLPRFVLASGNSTDNLLYSDSISTNPSQPGPDGTIPFLGDFNHRVDGFGLSGTNVIASFADQRSFITQKLADLPGPSPTLFQGSAAINASFNQAETFVTRAQSTMAWKFEVESATTIQLTWALAAAATGPNVLDRGFTGASLNLSDGTPEGVILSQVANFGELTEGGGFFTLNPGFYSLQINASLYAIFNEDDFTVPTELNQSAAYTVTLAVVPAPATLVPLAAVGSLIAPHRRRRSCA